MTSLASLRFAGVGAPASFPGQSYGVGEPRRGCAIRGRNSGRYCSATPGSQNSSREADERARAMTHPTSSFLRHTTTNSSCRAVRRKPQVRCAPLQGSWTGASIRYRVDRSVPGTRRRCLRLPASGGLSHIGVNGSETMARSTDQTQGPDLAECNAPGHTGSGPLVCSAKYFPTSQQPGVNRAAANYDQRHRHDTAAHCADGRRLRRSEGDGTCTAGAAATIRDGHERPAAGSATRATGRALASLRHPAGLTQEAA